MKYIRLSLLVALTSIPLSVMAGGITTISSQAQLDSFLTQNSQVVAQFYDPACPVCQKFRSSGIYESLARKNPRVAFIQVSSESPVFDKYSISATPTFIFFKNTREQQRESGRFSESRFQQIINRVFGK